MPAIRIGQQSFTFPTKWPPGHRLSPGEAQALSQIFAENVRKNVDHWVGKELDSQGQLSPEMHSKLQAKIQAYAANYEFKFREPRAKIKTFQEEHLYQLAEEAIRVKFNLGEEDYLPQVDLENMMTDPDLVAEAQRRAQAERAIAQAALEAIL